MEDPNRTVLEEGLIRKKPSRTARDLLGGLGVIAMMIGGIVYVKYFSVAGKGASLTQAAFVAFLFQGMFILMSMAGSLLLRLFIKRAHPVVSKEFFENNVFGAVVLMSLVALMMMTDSMLA